MDYGPVPQSLVKKIWCGQLALAQNLSPDEPGSFVFAKWLGTCDAEYVTAACRGGGGAGVKGSPSVEPNGVFAEANPGHGRHSVHRLLFGCEASGAWTRSGHLEHLRGDTYGIDCCRKRVKFMGFSPWIRRWPRAWCGLSFASDAFRVAFGQAAFCDMQGFAHTQVVCNRGRTNGGLPEACSIHLWLGDGGGAS